MNAMPGLMRVPYKVTEVSPAVPPVEIPLAEVDAEGKFTRSKDQRHVLVGMRDLNGGVHRIAFDYPTAKKFYSDLAEALKRLENCHEC